VALGVGGRRRPGGPGARAEHFDTNLVVGSASTVISRIQHAVDGAAIATVTLNEVPGSLTLVHTGALTIFSGRLRVGDAANEETDACELPAGTYELRVFMDETEHPTRVHFVLSR
jgi:hypothetical protein